MAPCNIASVILLLVITGPLILCLPHHTVYGAVSVWGGVNNYFLYTVSASDRAAHLNAMQANGIKVGQIGCNDFQVIIFLYTKVYVIKM